MNLTSIGLLVLIVVLGGLIALIADRLGRTLGKKRLSLFGLRPRHTAEFLTVTAGALIPLITFLVIMAASSEVRTWIAEGPSVINKRDQLAKDVVNLNKEKETGTAQLKSVNVKLTDSENRLMGLTSDLKGAAEKLKTTNSKLASLAVQFKALTANYRRVDNEFRSTKKNLADLHQQYATLDKTYKTLNQSYATLHGQQKEVLQENLRLMADNDLVSKEVQQGKAESAAQQESIDRLKKAQASLEQDYQDATKNLAAKLTELSQAQFKADEQRALADEARKMLQSDILASRMSSIMYQHDDEVARLVIDRGLSAVQARAAVDDLLRLARMAATERGAQPSKNGLPAARLFGQDPRGKVLSVDEQESAIIDQVTNLKESALLVTYSALNAFKGESVPLSVHKYPNPLVFRGGELVAESRINGRLSEPEIIQAVTEFVQTNVNNRAHKANMIPSANEPIIQFTIPQIFDLVKQIKIENRTVRLSAYADGDTRAAGPLKLIFNFQ